MRQVPIASGRRETFSPATCNRRSASPPLANVRHKYSPSRLVTTRRTTGRSRGGLCMDLPRGRAASITGSGELAGDLLQLAALGGGEQFIVEAIFDGLFDIRPAFLGFEQMPFGDCQVQAIAGILFICT